MTEKKLPPKLVAINFAHSMNRDPLVAKLRAAVDAVLKEEGYNRSEDVGPESHEGILFKQDANDDDRVLIVHRETSLEDYYEADGFLHLDDWLDKCADEFKDKPEYGDVAYARWWLFLFRLKNSLKDAFLPFTGRPKLFCTYQGERYRCTGCSRLGDVWISKNALETETYDVRVEVTELTEWSDNWANLKRDPDTLAGRDVNKDWNEFWKDIVCYPGGKTMNPHLVKCELSDYRQFMNFAAEVYCHVTGDQVSKVNTLPSVVIELANEWAARRAEEEKEDQLLGQPHAVLAKHWVTIAENNEALLQSMRVVYDQDHELFQKAHQAYGVLMAHHGEHGVEFARRLEECQGYLIFIVEDAEWWIAKDADEIRQCAIDNKMTDRETAESMSVAEIPACSYFTLRFLADESTHLLDPVKSMMFLQKLELEIRSGFDGPFCFASDQ